MDVQILHGVFIMHRVGHIHHNPSEKVHHFAEPIGFNGHIVIDPDAENFIDQIGEEIDFGFTGESLVFGRVIGLSPHHMGCVQLPGALLPEKFTVGLLQPV